MPASTPERILLFSVGHDWLFKRWFEREWVFEALKRWYVPGQYRFEVPEDDLEAVSTTLSEAGFEPVPVEDPTVYAVVIDRHTPYADILRNAVVHWERDGHRFFILRDAASRERAIQDGARPLEDTSFVLGV